jgi:hypothetical protein
VSSPPCRRSRRLPAGKVLYDGSMAAGPEFVKRRPEITMDAVDKYVTKMFLTDADFVFTVKPRFCAQLPDARAGHAG